LKESNLFQLCIPTSIRHDYLHSIHDFKFGGGHLGVSKCWEKLRNWYWWPNYYEDMKKYVLSCHLCQKRKGRTIGVPLQPNLRVFKILECVGVDVLGPLPRTKTGFRYIIVFVDHFSSWAEAYPLKEATAQATAEAFIQFFCRWGAPAILLSDRGSNFLSTMIQEINQIFNINPRFTTAYHPQTNGKVERFNSTIVSILSMYVSMKGDDWDKFIPFALYAYNTSRHQQNKFTPYYMMFGREARYLNEGNIRLDSDTYLSVGEFPRYIIKNIRRAHKLAQDHQRDIYSGYFLNSMMPPSLVYYPGDLVLLKLKSQPEGEKPHTKFSIKWDGPYEVVKRINNVVYQIRIPKGEKTINYITHVNRLKQYKLRDQNDPDFKPLADKTREQLLQQEVDRIERRQHITANADQLDEEYQQRVAEIEKQRTGSLNTTSVSISLTHPNSM
jgi:transposase InsO family protein